MWLDFSAPEFPNLFSQAHEFGNSGGLECSHGGFPSQTHTCSLLPVSIPFTLTSKLDQACSPIFPTPWSPNYLPRQQPPSRGLCGQPDTSGITSRQLPSCPNFPPGRLFQLTNPSTLHLSCTLLPFPAPDPSRSPLRDPARQAYTRAQVTVLSVLCSTCVELFRELFLVVAVGRLRSPG